jgi:hypothetical protein
MMTPLEELKKLMQQADLLKKAEQKRILEEELAAPALETLKSLLSESTPKHISKEVVEEFIEVEVEAEQLYEKDPIQMAADLLSRPAKPELSEDLESQRYNDPLSNAYFVTQTLECATKEIIEDGVHIPVLKESPVPVAPIPQPDPQYATQAQMNDHYSLLLKRIQAQMSTIGGGGEVKLRMLDDVDRSTIADGLNLRYNATSTKFEFVQPSAKAYHVTKTANSTAIDTSVPQIIPHMTLNPTSGTYIVDYNSKFGVVDTSSVTLAAKNDTIALYADLSTRSATGAETSRSASDTYANETLGPGVYIHTGAVTVNGTLTLNGSSTDEFIFRTAGAFTTGTFAEIELTGGATSSNVWFVAAGAPSTGANTTLRGNFIANQAAPSLGATTSFEGRMLAVNGAIAIGEACVITAPTGTATTSIGGLAAFNLFTGLGAVTNTGTVTTVALSIGTHGGAISGFVADNVGGSLIPGGATENSRIRIGVYVDGVLIDDSRRTYDHPPSSVDQEYPIVLKTISTITVGQTIDIRASSSFGEQLIGPRMAFILTRIS